MKYSIEGLGNNEVIKAYFVRENDILVRYLNGRNELFPKDYKDTIDKIMLSQAVEFLNSKGDARVTLLEEYGIYGVMAIYYEVFLELFIKSFINPESMSISTMGVLFFMWFLSPHIHEFINFELDVNPRLTKEKLDDIKKYALYIKNIDRLKDYKYEEDNIVNINTVQYIPLKKVKKIVREAKRNDRR